MRVIVCGSRDWNDYSMILEKLWGLRQTCFQQRDAVTVIEGAARGADRLAGQAARALGMTIEEHPADWAGRGRSAGFERNKLMLSLGADLVWAFKDGFDHTLQRGGTEHMVKLAKDAGVPWRVFFHD